MTSADSVGTEDVLNGDVPEPPAPRTRFTRKRDYVVVALIVVAVLATSVVVWRTSEFRATASTTTDKHYDEPADPEFFPPSLGEAWRAESPATPQPAIAGPTVVTGEGGVVSGRDPLTGDVRWTYKRDLPLCTVAAEWNLAIAVYKTSENMLHEDDPRRAGGCSEMTSLKGMTGERDRQRNSDAELGTRLVGDGTYLTATGERLLLSMRSDLVKTMEYGQLPALVNPAKQPRTECAYKSVTITTAGRVGVIERCPSDAAARMTVYKTSPKESDSPEVVTSVVVGSESAQIVAMNDKLTAVAMPDPNRLVVYQDDGNQVASYDLDLGAGDLRADPPGRVAPVTSATGAFYWFTGSRTIVVSSTDLHPLWTIQDTLGPGVVFAGRALLPVKGAIAVHSQADGQLVGTIPVDRGGYTGPVAMDTSGPMVFEQRGTTLVALH
ncbi:Rv3212 family protein [Actinokineospora sp. HUAS TT18]|uniref:Rv3212 family protein n=1 Tax=Actinokineospora sp. HUAS TT18 TaxID=3447451 RepID=UPI003F521EDB